MSTLQLPRAFENVAAGEAMVTVQEQGAVVFVRISDEEMIKLPRLCLLDVRLGAWERQSAIAIALLLRIEKKVELTYEMWINGAAPNGVGVLKNLSRQRDIYVRLVSGSEQRPLRTRNTVSLRAARLVAELTTRRTWTEEDFEHASQWVDMQYPTFSRLWVAIRDERFPF